MDNWTFLVHNFFLIIDPFLLLPTFTKGFCRFMYNLEKMNWETFMQLNFCHIQTLVGHLTDFFFIFFWKLSKVCKIENWKFFETSKSFSFTQMSAYLLTVKRILFCKSAPSTSKIFSEIENYLEMKLSWSLQDWKKVFHFLSWWSLYFYISKRTQL